MSRTYVHTPYWVAQNRAAERDPYNNIDHEHARKPIYGPSFREKVERTVDVRVIHHYEFTPLGTPFPVYGYTSVVREYSTYHRGPLIGWTEGTCDYRPLSVDRKWAGRYEGCCTPTWYPFTKGVGRAKYYYSSGWGHSYADEKREYWGGVRTRERAKDRNYTKLYNSGEDLGYEDGFTRKEGSKNQGGWWW